MKFSFYLVFFLLILVTLKLNTIAPKFLKQGWNMWLGYGVPALLMILFLGVTSKPAQYELFNDFFTGYYPAGRLILHNPSALYDTKLYNNMFGFVNLPIIALLCTPFTALNSHHAVILFTILGSLAILATCYFLVRLTKVFGSKRIALLGLFVINGPLYHSLRYANLSHFLILLLLAVLVCIERKREFWIGVLLAIAASIKLPLLLLGSYFVMRGRLRVSMGFGAALLMIVGMSLLLFGVDLHLTWLQHIEQFSGKPISAYNVQSVDAFLARLLLNTNEALENWNPIEVGWDFKVIRYALLSLLIGITIWICWRSKPPMTLEEENLEFSIVLCLALIISPISWTHYYLLLLLPFSLYFGNRLGVPQGQFWSTSMVVSILLISLPVIIVVPANPLLRFLYSRLLISHYFFGGVLLLGVLLAARWQVSKRSKLPQSHTIDPRAG